MPQHTVVAHREATKNKRKKAPVVLAALGLLALVPLVGTTFAASISLGSGSIEFGQGTRTAAACDTAIDASLGTVIASGAFSSTNLTLKTVDTTACKGKKILVRLADSTPALLQLGSSASQTVCTITVPDMAASGSATGDDSTSTGGCSWVFKTSSGGTFTTNASDSQIVVTFAGTVAPSNVAKVLLESQG